MLIYILATIVLVKLCRVVKRSIARPRSHGRIGGKQDKEGERPLLGGTNPKSDSGDKKVSDSTAKDSPSLSSMKKIEEQVPQ